MSKALEAVATPIVVDDHLVRFNLQLHLDPLVASLQETNKAVAQNGRILQQLCVEVGILKDQFSSFQSTTQRQFETVESGHDELSRSVHELIHRCNQDRQKNATKDALTHEVSVITERIKQCEGFIEEVERGGGERVEGFVRGYVENFVPRWYESVSTTLWSRINSAIDKSAENSNRQTDGKLQAVKEVFTGITEAAKAESKESVASASAQQEAELRSVQKSLQQSVDKAMNYIATLDSVHRTALAKTNTSIVNKFCEVQKNALALHNLLCIDQSKCMAIFDSLVEKVNTILAPPQVEPDTYVGDTNITPVEPISFPTVEYEVIKPPGPAECGPEILNLIEDVRVSYLQQTPPFFGLRCLLQRELVKTVDTSQEKIQDDLDVQLDSIQKELKTKVSQKRLVQFMWEHRDQDLYNNVSKLLNDMGEVQKVKVDTTTFNDILRQKADLHVVELKVDKERYNEFTTDMEDRFESIEIATQGLVNKYLAKDQEYSEIMSLLKTGKTREENRQFEDHRIGGLLMFRADPKHSGATMAEQIAAAPNSLVVQGAEGDADRRDLYNTLSDPEQYAFKMKPLPDKPQKKPDSPTQRVSPHRKDGRSVGSAQRPLHAHPPRRPQQALVTPVLEVKGVGDRGGLIALTPRQTEYCNTVGVESEAATNLLRASGQKHNRHTRSARSGTDVETQLAGQQQDAEGITWSAEYSTKQSARIAQGGRHSPT